MAPGCPEPGRPRLFSTEVKHPRGSDQRMREKTNGGAVVVPVPICRVWVYRSDSFPQGPDLKAPVFKASSLRSGSLQDSLKPVV